MCLFAVPPLSAKVRAPESPLPALRPTRIESFFSARLPTLVFFIVRPFDSIAAACAILDIRLFVLRKFFLPSVLLRYHISFFPKDFRMESPAPGDDVGLAPSMDF